MLREELRYLGGFGNHFETEALPGALPKGKNSPQKPAYGLYAEQMSGTAFSAPRAENLRTWMYRIHPSVGHGPMEPFSKPRKFHPIPAMTPEPLRWGPLSLPKTPTSFLEGLFPIAGNGDPKIKQGCLMWLYAFNQPMPNAAFYSADGEWLFIPEKGGLRLRTELGYLEVHSEEIGLIPRGVRFQVEPLQGPCRGYICENFAAPFRLPYLSIIGANGLANPRDFQCPVATFEEKGGPYTLYTKFLGNFWQFSQAHSPFDVVAWHGNYAPYKYDLRRFQALNSVSFDHPDPSIFTVLTSPSEIPGTANADFVIFPPRWSVAEDTFRPPYFHRNTMSEYMGLIHGAYDAKTTGFVPGGGSLHNCFTPHGPDAHAFRSASEQKLEPKYLGDSLAFMVESRLPFECADWALSPTILQKDYLDCWQGMPHLFSGG